MMMSNSRGLSATAFLSFVYNESTSCDNAVSPIMVYTNLFERLLPNLWNEILWSGEMPAVIDTVFKISIFMAVRSYGMLVKNSENISLKAANGASCKTEGISTSSM